MNDENSNGAGNGHDPGAFGDDDETQVELGDGLVMGSGRRLAEALMGAGRGVHAALDLVEESPGGSPVPALGEIKGYLRNLIPIIQGQLRAVSRLEANATKRERQKTNGNGHAR